MAIPGVGHSVAFIDTKGNRVSMLQSIRRKRMKQPDIDALEEACGPR
jgi:hypothetical protein